MSLSIIVDPNRSLKAFQELALNYELTVDQELQKSWGVSYSSLIEQILQFAGISDGDRVLDIATGTGLIPRAIVSLHGQACRVIGLDITFAALQLGKCKINVDREPMPIFLTCATATALPFAPNAFDYVICALATHHIPQPQLLEQIASVLKPGGQVLLADVVASPVWRFPGVRSCLRLTAYIYFLFTVSPARAWVESEAVSFVHTEKEWIASLSKYNFSSIQVCKPSIRRTWAPAGMMVKAVKDGI